MVRLKYFCHQHIAALEKDESAALTAWQDLMQRGLRAYCACRMDMAELYLSAAKEIGQIRAVCERNAVFNNLHVAKPDEFLSNISAATKSSMH